jgi:hypothetical protein
LSVDPQEAARVAKILLESNPYQKDYLKRTLDALRNSKNHRNLAHVYEEAKGRFAELGEILPDQWAVFLASPTNQ